MDYFEARNLNGNIYENHKLPLHLKQIILDLKPDARILDFGCGFGQNLKAINTLIEKTSNGGGAYTEGIDINDQAIAFCQDNKLNAHKIQDIFSHIPKEKFDLIITTHVLEHFPKDKIIPLLTHFKNNFLTKDGKLYIAVPNVQSNTGAYWAYEDFTHHTLFSSGSLFYVLKMAGFNKIDFLDIDCLEDIKGIKKYLRKSLLRLYKLNHNFWNKITASAYHAQSLPIYSYEIKALAQI